MEASEEQAVIRVVVAPVYGTNCYIVSAGGDCVIVDVGGGVAPDVLRVVRSVGLTPRAVLATHGHADHTWDAGIVAGHYDIPFVVHAADEYRVRDPFGSIDAPGAPIAETMAAALASVGVSPEDYHLPARIEPFDLPGGEADLTFGAVRLRAVHAPGHTEGSTLYLVGTPRDGVALTGDVLFAGSIGRTDLPGGDWPAMARTIGALKRLDPAWRVCPGHGPASTIARELVANPFLVRA